MRNTIHLKLENGFMVGTGKISKQRLREYFGKDKFLVSQLDSIIEECCGDNYWIETDKAINDVPCHPRTPLERFYA